MNTRKNIFTMLGLAGLFAVGYAAPTRAQEFSEVTVTGEGISKDAAKKDAMRKAMEEGGKVEISSHSQAENFVLIRDSIFARAEGFITEHKVLQEGEGAGGTFTCKIWAKVSRSAIATTWGEVQNILDQIGRPGIAIFIKETIDNQVQDSSILESKLEERLIKAGFDVYNGAQLKAIAEKESADALAEDNIAKLQGIAKSFSAQIFITGHANANAAGVANLAGQEVAMYNGDAVAKMYYTDTGKLLASESIPNWRGGARGIFTHSPQAGKKALENSGVDLIEKIYATVMQQWCTQVTAGGEVRLEIEGISMGDAIKLKKKIAAIPGVETVNGPQLDKGIATFRIVAKMTAEQMVEHLVEGEFEQMIDIVDAKLNRIQAKKK
ncbi:MAG: hypothetical protein IT449_13315 [Phycisphaerales bacterium]|nr:hypothetical protein [Phycisphaerales bacterium]